MVAKVATKPKFLVAKEKMSLGDLTSRNFEPCLPIHKIPLQRYEENIKPISTGINNHYNLLANFVGIALKLETGGPFF